VDAGPGFDDFFHLWQRSILGLGLLGVGASSDWLARKATAAWYNVTRGEAAVFSSFPASRGIRFFGVSQGMSSTWNLPP
jgi:hypothetical protein